MTPEQKRILELETEVAYLKSIIVQLIEKIDNLTHPKNSRNSSVPPSQDQNRGFKNKSLRTSKGRKIGGQTGHEGNTLKMVEHPDEVVEHKPDFCCECGKDLSNIPSELLGRRQVVDIPPIHPIYTEHRVYKKTCSCGHCTTSDFPLGVNTSISYGANIEATIAYLHTRQYLPYERMSEFFKDFCNVPISQGSISNLLERFAQKSQASYDLIAKVVENSVVVGTDETGVKVNGKKGWFWTWQSKKATYISYSPSRGTVTINNNFANGFPKSVLVHDCWASHFQTNCQTHQICTAHLLRELNFFEERYKSKWAENFKSILLNALELQKNTTTIQEFENRRAKIIQNLTNILQTEITEIHKDLRAFYRRMVKFKNYIFTFLFHYDVPPDNNASERAIRNIKVKQKISGQFKTETGAKIYAVIRSITDTCIKNDQNILAAFKTIAQSCPQIV